MASSRCFCLCPSCGHKVVDDLFPPVHWPTVADHGVSRRVVNRWPRIKRVEWRNLGPVVPIYVSSFAVIVISALSRRETGHPALAAAAALSKDA
jgi:hypothetical protein